MYLYFYGLREMPFSNVPDTNFLFKSKQHTEALNCLLFGVTAKEGFIVLTGDIGTGKTTLCRTILQKLDGKVESALIFNPPSTPVDLLKTILHDLGVKASASSKNELLDMLNTYLLQCSEKGKQVIIIMDEAQNFSQEMLEEIRLLSNLETEKQKLIQIILSGQTELLEKLSSKSLTQLAQRISLQYHLTPLAKKDVSNYIHYRLNKAGACGDIVFTKRAVSKVCKFSRGIPRVINIICDKALLAGYTAQRKKITEKMVDEAIKTIYCDYRHFSPFQLKLGYSIMGLIILGLFVMGFLTGDWTRLVKWNKSIAIAQYAEAKTPDFLLYTSKHPAIELFDADGVMRQSKKIDCAREALATILKIWGIEENVLLKKTREWKDEKVFSFHDKAKTFGLKVSPVQSTIEQIKIFSCPCIVPIHDLNYRYVVLSGLFNDRVVLLDPAKGKVVLPLAKFQEIWTKKVFYVWKDFALLPVVMKKGDVSKKVIVIKKGLKALHYFSGSSLSMIFDERLEEAVKKLQERFGLESDGILGSHTKIAFYRLLYPEQIPRLQ